MIFLVHHHVRISHHVTSFFLSQILDLVGVFSFNLHEALFGQRYHRRIGYQPRTGPMVYFSIEIL